VLACFIRTDETGVYANIVLFDLSNNQHFSRQHIDIAQYHASTVAYFGSEEAIMSEMHLMWLSYEEKAHYYENDHLHVFTEQRSTLQTPDGYFFYGELSQADSGSVSLIEKMENDAKRQQLHRFRSSLEALSNTEGLYYHIEIEIPEITTESVHVSVINEENGFYHRRINISDINPADFSVVTYSNIDENGQIPYEENLQFFRELPVFFTIDSTNQVDQSFQDNSSYTYTFYGYPDYNWSSPFLRFDSIMLGFSDWFVAAQNNIYSVIRDAYILDIGIIAACAVLVLAMIIILMVGAGRQYVRVDGKRERSEGVHFSPVDKPYLDLGLALIACWTAFTGFFALVLGEEVWRHRNIVLLNIILAVTILLVVPPVLFWLMNLIKRLKAGRFWRHTLIYAILYSCLYGSLCFIIRKLKAMWAGLRLALKVGVISFTAFIIMFFVGAVGAVTNEVVAILFTVVILTALIAFILTLYARRIRNLELGARIASEGNYDIPINAGGGELGNIAYSINSISAGINTAVEERMKSERLKTELITNVSHDIRTPLTSIITYTDLLEHEGLDCEKAPDYLDILKQKSLRLKTLTDELFEAAKASTGNIDVNLIDLDVVSLINQVLGELDSSIKSSGLDLRISMPERLTARADGRLMQRVIENLLSNVFKYSLSGSRVYLDAYEADTANIRIDIKNISATELNFDPSELTERFKRGDDSRADGGSGLGLSIVQSFVGAQGGKFEISIDGDLFKATVLLPVPPVMPE